MPISCETEQGEWIDCPIFCGIDLEKWIVAIENFFLQFDIPAIQYTNLASHHVGVPSTSVAQYEESVGGWSWYKFIGVLRAEFAIPESLVEQAELEELEDKAVEELRHREQEHVFHDINGDLGMKDIVECQDSSDVKLQSPYMFSVVPRSLILMSLDKFVDEQSQIYSSQYPNCCHYECKIKNASDTTYAIDPGDDCRYEYGIQNLEEFSFSTIMVKVMMCFAQGILCQEQQGYTFLAATHFLPQCFKWTYEYRSNRHLGVISALQRAESPEILEVSFVMENACYRLYLMITIFSKSLTMKLRERGGYNYSCDRSVVELDLGHIYSEECCPLLHSENPGLCSGMTFIGDSTVGKVSMAVPWVITIKRSRIQQEKSNFSASSIEWKMINLMMIPSTVIARRHLILFPAMIDDIFCSVIKSCVERLRKISKHDLDVWVSTVGVSMGFLFEKLRLHISFSLIFINSLGCLMTDLQIYYLTVMQILFIAPKTHEQGTKHANQGVPYSRNTSIIVDSFLVNVCLAICAQFPFQIAWKHELSLVHLHLSNIEVVKCLDRGNEVVFIDGELTVKLAISVTNFSILCMVLFDPRISETVYDIIYVRLNSKQGVGLLEEYLQKLGSWSCISRSVVMWCNLCSVLIFHSRQSSTLLYVYHMVAFAWLIAWVVKSLLLHYHYQQSSNSLYVQAYIAEQYHMMEIYIPKEPAEMFSSSEVDCFDKILISWIEKSQLRCKASRDIVFILLRWLPAGHLQNDYAIVVLMSFLSDMDYSIAYVYALQFNTIRDGGKSTIVTLVRNAYVDSIWIHALIIGIFDPRIVLGAFKNSECMALSGAIRKKYNWFGEILGALFLPDQGAACTLLSKASVLGFFLYPQHKISSNASTVGKWNTPYLMEAFKFEGVIIWQNNGLYIVTSQVSLQTWIMVWTASAWVSITSGHNHVCVVVFSCDWDSISGLSTYCPPPRFLRTSNLLSIRICSDILGVGYDWSLAGNTQGWWWYAQLFVCISARPFDPGTHTNYVRLQYKEKTFQRPTVRYIIFSFEMVTSSLTVYSGSVSLWRSHERFSLLDHAWSASVSQEVLGNCLNLQLQFTTALLVQNIFYIIKGFALL